MRDSIRLVAASAAAVLLLTPGLAQAQDPSPDPASGQVDEQVRQPEAKVPVTVIQKRKKLKVTVDWDDKLDTRRGRDAFHIRAVTFRNKPNGKPVARVLGQVNRRGDQPDTKAYRLKLNRQDRKALRRADKAVVAVTQQHDGRDKDKLYEANYATITRITHTTQAAAESPELRACGRSLIRRGADLSRCDLTGAFLPRAVLDDADLSRATLTRANLTRAWLTRANLTEALLARADLAGATLTDAKLRDAVLTDPEPEPGMRSRSLGANLTDADLIGADLTRADLRDTTLSDADLSEANQTEANLSGATLARANLTRAILRNAFLGDTNLREAVLIEADLTNADLTRAFLERANLQRADLTGADLSWARLSGARWTDGSMCREFAIGACH